MTHAETELERLKDAFEKWCEESDLEDFHVILKDETGLLIQEKSLSIQAAKSAAALFFPFVAYALSDMQGSAEKTAMLNRFKHALGMELMAHEHFFGDEK